MSYAEHVCPAHPMLFLSHICFTFLRQKFENPGLVETNRQIFHNRRQCDNESAEDFVYALQSLAVDCLFDADSYTDIMKSRLIGGVCNDSTRGKLMLKFTNMNYDQTKILFTQIEAVRAQSRRIALANTANAVFEDTNELTQPDVQRVTQRFRWRQPPRPRSQVQQSQGGSAAPARKALVHTPFNRNVLALRSSSSPYTGCLSSERVVLLLVPWQGPCHQAMCGTAETKTSR